MSPRTNTSEIKSVSLNSCSQHSFVVGRNTVAVLRSFGKAVKLPFNLKHTSAELSELVDELLAIKGETGVVMEHTGRYYELIAKVTHKKRLVCQYHQPLVNQEIRRQYFAQGKDRQIRLAKIASYALDNRTDLRDYTPTDTVRYNLKTNSLLSVLSFLKAEDSRQQ